MGISTQELGDGLYGKYKELLNKTSGKSDTIKTTKLIVAELISSKNIKIDNSEEIENILGPISVEIEKIIGDSLTEESFIKNLIKVQRNSPERFLSNFIKKEKINFNIPTPKEKDIPVQSSESVKNGVPSKYNGTIGMLKDQNGDIVMNPEIKEVLLELDIKEEDISNIAKYHPGTGMETFIEAMKKLIETEEEYYGWKETPGTQNRKGVETKPYFVPGGVPGLVILRDYFLKEGGLVIVPNKRWTNVASIMENKTEVPMAIANIINDDGTIDLSDLEEMIDNGIENGRQTISIYLNFPNNPTGSSMSPSDATNLNTLLKKYSESDIDINLCIDDPYGIFSTKSKTDEGKYQVCPPLSYYIDTDTNVNVVEVGSHGTKESGMYGGRVSVLKVFTSEQEKTDLEKYLNGASRATFSMSPSLPQIILIKAILGKDMDVFNMEKFNKLPKEEQKARITKYIKAREKMMDVIQPKLQEMKKEILDLSGEYLVPIENKQNGEEHTGGFFVSFSLSDLAKELGITTEAIRNKCNEAGEEGCGMIATSGTLRITLISGEPKEFAKRLHRGIEKLI